MKEYLKYTVLFTNSLNIEVIDRDKGSCNHAFKIEHKLLRNQLGCFEKGESISNKSNKKHLMILLVYIIYIQAQTVYLFRTKHKDTVKIKHSSLCMYKYRILPSRKVDIALA